MGGQVKLDLQKKGQIKNPQPGGGGFNVPNLVNYEL